MKDSTSRLKNVFGSISDADTSCLAALQKLDISRYSDAFASCQADASTRKNANLILREPTPRPFI
jgi:hypothetical protein